jgi:transcriptional regulator with GAF, ATPase, and Fis domain
MSEVEGQRSGYPDNGTAHEDLTGRLSDLAREFAAHRDSQSTLDAVVQAAVEAIPGAEHASVSVTRRRGPGQTLAATSDLARQVDQAQYDTSQGPCLDTLYEHHTVRCDDMRDERRWPEFARRACEAGVGSMLSLQLYVDGDDLGALNLFSTQVRGFSDESERAGLAFAGHASVAVAAAQEIETLRRAVDSRDTIGQAKGILMERHAITASVAFSVLVRYSRDNNVKLVDVASNVIGTSRAVRSAETR